MRRVGLAAAGILASTGAWTTLLAVSPPYRGDTAVVMMAGSLWTATVVAVTGMLVARARWARRLGLSVAGAAAATGLLIPFDVWWAAALVVSALAAVWLGGPWLDGIIRGRPSASGPPTRAVLIPLLLIAVPYLLGVSGADGAAAIALASTALLSAYWFVRTLPGALTVVRVLWPGTALALAPVMGWPQGVGAGVAALAVAAAAWHPTVRNAVHPLVETGSRVKIPPELAPREILDAADIDERGRPR